MASSILRLTSQLSKAAAGSCLRRVSIPENHLRRILCSAGMSTTTAAGDSAVKRIAPPWLMLPPSSVEGGDTACYSMYSPSQGTVARLDQETQSPYPHHNAKVVGSSHGWLAFFNERPKKLFLRNPITHESINLPLVNTYALQVKDVSKVILSCPPDQGEEGDDECVAVMAFASPVGEKLAYCRPGRSHTWTTFGGLTSDIGLMKQIPDFMYSSKFKRIFCLSEMEGKLGFGTGSWYLRRGETSDKVGFRFIGSEPYLEGDEKYKIPRDDRRLRRRLYVVCAEHSDQLFVVTRLIGEDTDKTVGFHVHRLCNKGFFGPSIEIQCYMKESLDGLVMFVGPNHSAAVPAAEFPELKPNSIYFAGDDVGVYDYENKTISPCYYRSDVVQRIQPPAFWFTPTTVPAQRLGLFPNVSGSGGGDDDFCNFVKESMRKNAFTGGDDDFNKRFENEAKRFENAFTGGNDNFYEETKSFRNVFTGGTKSRFKNVFSGVDDNFYGGTKISDLSGKHKGIYINNINMVINGNCNIVINIK